MIIVFWFCPGRIEIPKKGHGKESGPSGTKSFHHVAFSCWEMFSSKPGAFLEEITVLVNRSLEEFQEMEHELEHRLSGTSSLEVGWANGSGPDGVMRLAGLAVFVWSAACGPAGRHSSRRPWARMPGWPQRCGNWSKRRRDPRRFARMFRGSFTQVDLLTNTAAATWASALATRCN